MADFQVFVAGMLSEGRPVRFEARGTSMAPAIRDGDSIEVHPVAVGDVRRGDILLYRSEGRLVAHRVVEADAFRRFALKADRGDGLDWIGSEQLLGRVISRARRGSGRWVDLRTPGHRWSGLLVSSLPSFLRPYIL